MNCNLRSLIMLVHKIIHRIWIKMYAFYIRLLIGKCGSNLHIEFPSIIYAPECIKIGDNVHIRDHAWFNCTPNPNNDIVLKIGNETYLGRFIEISAKEEVEIGRNVMIADRVYIGDHGHVFEDPNVPIIKQPLTAGKKITIKDGAWIGVG